MPLNEVDGALVKDNDADGCQTPRSSLGSPQTGECRERLLQDETNGATHSGLKSHLVQAKA